MQTFKLITCKIPILLLRIKIKGHLSMITLFSIELFLHILMLVRKIFSCHFHIIKTVVKYS